MTKTRYFFFVIFLLNCLFLLQMVSTCNGDFSPVAEIMVTANQVATFLTKTSLLGLDIGSANAKVDPKICDERFSDRLAVIPFGRMSSNLSASAMQSKANEYDRFISSNEKPMEFIISEMGDYIRRYKMF